MTFTIFCTSIVRVGGFVTTAIQFAYFQRLTSFFFGNNRNRTLDTTTLVVTTKDATELTTGHGQRDITFNDSFLSTAINSSHIIFWHTL